MKRSRQSTKATWRNILLVGAIIVILIIVLDPNNQRSSAPSGTPVIMTRPPETSVANVSTATIELTQTATPALTSTIAATSTEMINSTAPTQTLPPLATNIPQPTAESEIAVTAIPAQLYDVTGTANALRCPDTRCKVIETYKRRNIVVVIGFVNGSSFKGNKSKVWVQIISHAGTKVYVHASQVSPHTGS